MKRVRKGSDLPKKKWGSPSTQQKYSHTKLTQRSSALCFVEFSYRCARLKMTWHARDQWIACALEMRSSNGREHPQVQCGSCYGNFRRSAKFKNKNQKDWKPICFVRRNSCGLTETTCKINTLMNVWAKWANETKFNPKWRRTSSMISTKI